MAIIHLVLRKCAVIDKRRRGCRGGVKVGMAATHQHDVLDSVERHLDSLYLFGG